MFTKITVVNAWIAGRSHSAGISGIMLNRGIKIMSASMEERQAKMGKRQVIARALNQKGIPITEGIPENIISELKKNGYKIKKIK